MAAFYAGDIPAQPLTVEPALDLADFTTASATLTAPDGRSPITLDATLDQDGGTVAVAWTSTQFDVPGLWMVRVILASVAGGRQQLGEIPVAVDAIADGWYTLWAARADWRDASQLEDDALYRLLQTSKSDVLAYAPALTADSPIPEAYRAAQLMQARNRRNASRVNPANGQLGDDSFIVAPFPLDWQIRQLLRPRRGIPAVG